MDLRIGMVHAVDQHGRKVKGPGISGDLLQEIPDGGRCPRDQGLLVTAEQEDFIVRRCVNCGWRQYSALGKMVAKISQERALSETLQSDRRIASIKKGRDDGTE
jgi:hypothetical protein